MLGKLDTLLEKLEIEADTDTIENISNTDIDYETVKQELSKYVEIIINNVQKDNFSKIDENNYALTLNEIQSCNILKQILAQMKTSTLFKEENMQKQIDSIIQELNSATPTEAEFLKVVVNKNGTITITIENESTIVMQKIGSNLTITFTVEGTEFTVTLTKQESGNVISYNANVSAYVAESDGNVNISFGAQYTDIETEKTKENYTLEIAIEQEDDELSYSYNVDLNKTFKEDISIDNLDSNNSVTLNDLDKTYIETLMTAITAQIQSINRNQMKTLGLEETQNPLIYATPLGFYIQMTQQAMNQSQNAMSSLEKDQFNAMFISYQGLQSGGAVKALMTYVTQSNLANTDKLISVNGITDQMALSNLREQINTSSKYNVSVAINPETGFVNAITISY